MINFIDVKNEKSIEIENFNYTDNAALDAIIEFYNYETRVSEGVLYISATHDEATVFVDMYNQCRSFYPEIKGFEGSQEIDNAYGVATVGEKGSSPQGHFIHKSNGSWTVVFNDITYKVVVGSIPEGIAENMKIGDKFQVFGTNHNCQFQSLAIR